MYYPLMVYHPLVKVTHLVCSEISPQKDRGLFARGQTYRSGAILL